MPDNQFKQEVALAYLKGALDELKIPIEEFFHLYQKLSAIPELEDLSLNSFYEQSSQDRMMDIRPTGNVHFDAKYNRELGGLEEMTDLVREKTGLTLDDPDYWVNQSGRGDFLYRFSEGESIARVVLTPYTPKRSLVLDPLTFTYKDLRKPI